MVAGFHTGDCFPAGHASVAMWLVALAVFWLPHAPRRALTAYLGGLGIGMALVVAFSRQLYAAPRPTPRLAEPAAALTIT